MNTETAERSDRNVTAHTSDVYARRGLWPQKVTCSARPTCSTPVKRLPSSPPGLP